MLFLKFILAMLPIIWLIIALAVLKMPGYRACPIALIVGIIASMMIWKFSAINMATACVEGILNALWPICLVIVAAMFTYNLTLETKAMDKIKQMLTMVSNDKRVLVLIIAWGFGGFMEGMAGFGTAVAIPASMLVALGFEPIFSAVVCLVANAAPTAFGSVGVPTTTLGSVTGVDVPTLASATGLQLSLFMFITPFVMVAMCGKGFKGLKGMIPTTLISSLCFVVPFYLASHFLGAELPDILGSICCMVGTVIASRIFNRNPPAEFCISAEKSESSKSIALGEAIRAWMPFLLIFVLLMVTSSLIPPIHDFLAQFKSTVHVYAGDDTSTLSFSWVNTPGILIFIAAIIGGLVQGASFSTMWKVFKKTMVSMAKTILTICSVLALAKVMSHSGMISDIAKFFVAATGHYYPFVAPLIGALGAFVTGSGTSTTVLFGGLQAETASALGINAAWLASANTVGACIGKMICPQSIAIGVGAINQPNSDSQILKISIKYCVAYVILAGIVCFAGSLIL